MASAHGDSPDGRAEPRSQTTFEHGILGERADMAFGKRGDKRHIQVGAMHRRDDERSGQVEMLPAAAAKREVGIDEGADCPFEQTTHQKAGASLADLQHPLGEACKFVRVIHTLRSKQFTAKSGLALKVRFCSLPQPYCPAPKLQTRVSRCRDVATLEILRPPTSSA